MSSTDSGSTRDAANYGPYSEYLPPEEPSFTRPRADSSDRVWAVAAHLSTFVNAFTGFLGPVVAFVIWLVKRGDSPMAARHALRSVVYQTLWLIAIAVGWTVATALTAVLVGYLLFPVMAIVTIAPFVHAVVAAVGAWREDRLYV